MQALSFLTKGKQGCFPSVTHTFQASGLAGIVNNSQYYFLETTALFHGTLGEVQTYFSLMEKGQKYQEYAQNIPTPPRVGSGTKRAYVAKSDFPVHLSR